MTKADMLRHSHIGEHFGDRNGDASSIPSYAPLSRANKTVDRTAAIIAIDNIVCNGQVRTEFDDHSLEQLAHSLRTVGQQQHCKVYWDELAQNHVIIQGERRWRAAKLAGLDTLKCIVVDKPNDDDLVELQLVENAVRQDLNPIEEARAYQKLRDQRGYSTTQIAARIGKNQSTVARALSLLKLPESIQQQIIDGHIPPTIGRELVKLKTEDEQRDMLERYLRGELTSSDAEKETNSRKPAAKPSTSRKLKKSSFDGLELSAKMKTAHTQGDLARALLKWCDRVLDDRRSAHDQEELSLLLDAILMKVRNGDDQREAA